MITTDYCGIYETDCIALRGKPLGFPLRIQVIRPATDHYLIQNPCAGTGYSYVATIHPSGMKAWLRARRYTKVRAGR